MQARYRRITLLVYAALVLLLLGTALVTAGRSSPASVGVVLGAAPALGVVITLSTSGGGWKFTVRERWIVALFMTARTVALSAWNLSCADVVASRALRTD